MKNLMKNVIALSVFGAMAFMIPAAQASTQTGVIDNIQAMNDGRISVTLVNARPDKPSCAVYN